MQIRLLLILGQIILRLGCADFQIKDNGHWAICSPKSASKECDLSFSKLPEDVDCYDHIKELGQIANNQWLSNNGNKAQMVAEHNETFSTINQQFLAKLIDQILENPSLLKNVTDASYKNVTGFLKVVLNDSANDSWKLRLHVWDEKEDKEFPHNHKWDYYSKIITGYLKQEIYQKIAAARLDELSDQQAEEIIPCSVREPVSLMPLLPNGQLPCPCKDNYELACKRETPATQHLRCADVTRIANHESYFMSNDLIHTITPGRGAISFVFTSNKKTDNSEVFVPLARLNENLQKHAPSVSTDELVKELIRIKAIMGCLVVQPKYLPEIVDANHGYLRLDQVSTEKNWRDQLSINNTKKVVQLPKARLGDYKLNVNEGAVRFGKQAVTANQDYLFVIFDNQVYVAPKDFHHESPYLICHSSFTDYGPVQSAGVIQFNQNKQLVKIEPYSGHYAPSIDNMSTALDIFTDKGLDVSCAQIVAFADR